MSVIKNSDRAEVFNGKDSVPVATREARILFYIIFRAITCKANTIVHGFRVGMNF